MTRNHKSKSEIGLREVYFINSKNLYNGQVVQVGDERIVPNIGV